MKKILLAVLSGLVFVGAFLVAALPAFARVSTEVYVSDLNLQNTTIDAGTVVSGSFKLINAQDNPVSGLQYIVMFGSYDDKLNPLQTYDTKTYGPVSLDPLESKIVYFSYPVPTGHSGTNLGIRVIAVTQSGFRMGWDDTQLSVNGTRIDQLELTGANVAVDNKVYGIEDGPTVTGSSTAAYNVSLLNDNNDPITVTPKITLYKKDSSGLVVKVIPEDQAIIGAHASSTSSFSLPTDLPPDVYAGTVEFLDGIGNRRAPLLNFRYIIGGDIITIQSASVDKVSAQKGDVVNIGVVYTGTPEDITGASESASVINADLTIKLLNENNDVVGMSNDSLQFDAIGGQKTASITMLAPAQALHAEITVSKGADVLSSYNAVLSVIGEDQQNPNIWIPALLYAIAGLIILIVIIVLFRVLFRGGIHPPTPMVTAALFIIIALPFGLGATSYLQQQAATADSSNGTNLSPCAANGNNFLPVISSGESTAAQTDYSSHDYVPSVFVSYPQPAASLSATPPTSVNPGAQFNVAFRVTACACDNRPQKEDVEVQETYGNQVLKTDSVQQSALSVTNPLLGDAYYSSDFTFSVGSFTAPTTPGTYKIRIKVTNSEIRAFSLEGWVQGYVTYQVKAPPPPKTSTHNILSITAAGGTVSPLGDTSVKDGGSQAYKIIPDSSHIISRVRVDGTTIGTPATYTFSNVTDDHSISAFFDTKPATNPPTTNPPTTNPPTTNPPTTNPPTTNPPTNPSQKYIITSSAGTGGKINPSGSTSVNSGGSESYTITPDSSHVISDIAVDGSSVGNPAAYTFSNVTANHTISVMFKTKPPTPPTTPPTTNPPTTNPPTTNPPTTNPPTTNPPGGNPGGTQHTIVASAGPGGDITPNGTSQVSTGGSETFLIIPDAGYDITNVSVDNASIGTPTSYAFTNVANDHTISATFVLHGQSGGTVATQCSSQVTRPDGGTDNPARVAAVNQPVTYTATIANPVGTPPYTFIWTGDDTTNSDRVVISATTATLIKSYSRIGDKTISVSMTDATGKWSGQTPCTVGTPTNQVLNVSVHPDWGQF